MAIQEAVDLAFHIVADEGWGVPSSYAESFDMLCRHGVIDAACLACLVLMAVDPARSRRAGHA